MRQRWSERAGRIYRICVVELCGPRQTESRSKVRPRDITGAEYSPLRAYGRFGVVARRLRAGATVCKPKAYFFRPPVQRTTIRSRGP